MVWHRGRKTFRTFEDADKFRRNINWNYGAILNNMAWIDDSNNKHTVRWESDTKIEVNKNAKWLR